MFTAQDINVRFQISGNHLPRETKCRIQQKEGGRSTGSPRTHVFTHMKTVRQPKIYEKMVFQQWLSLNVHKYASSIVSAAERSWLFFDWTCCAGQMNIPEKKNHISANGSSQDHTTRTSGQDWGAKPVSPASLKTFSCFTTAAAISVPFLTHVHSASKLDAEVRKARQGCIKTCPCTNIFPSHLSVARSFNTSLLMSPFLKPFSVRHTFSQTSVYLMANV